MTMWNIGARRMSALRAIVGSAVTLGLWSCGGGGGSAEGGKGAKTYALAGTLAGLRSGKVVLSNGVERVEIVADDGLSQDRPIEKFTPLPAGTNYDVQVVDQPPGVTCEVVNGTDTMPTAEVNNVLVLCAQLKSLLLLAGEVQPSLSQDGIGTAAGFNNPTGLAVDASGNVYVADTSNSTIRKITPAGVVSTLAGLAGLRGSANGPRGLARFNEPEGVAVDTSGNVYVADTDNHTVRRVTPDGVVSTLAGLAGSSGSNNGTGEQARFNAPEGIASDANGNLYVADTQNSTIRKITPAGVVSTLAGVAGIVGRADGAGEHASFSRPGAVVVDASGNLYVLDARNDTIRKVTLNGVVSTFAGLDTPGEPRGIAIDTNGNLYIAYNFGTIQKVTPSGEVSALATPVVASSESDGAGSEIRFQSIQGIAADASGNLYVAADDNFELGSAGPHTGAHIIRKLTPAGVVIPLAGIVEPPPQDGIGAQARFRTPVQIAVDATGNLYVSQLLDDLRKVSAAGVVTTPAGFALSQVSEIAFDASNNFLYSIGIFGSGIITKSTPSGVSSTLAGRGAQIGGIFGSTDGPGVEALFNGPSGLTVDLSGNVYVADTGNHTIRKITPDGFVSTLAGLAGATGSVNGTGMEARFHFPQDVAVDATGDLYVTDSSNHTVRKITPDGVVSTLAGLAGTSGSADGTGSQARFSSPDSIAVDASGNLYVLDKGTSSIRAISINQSSGEADVVTIVSGGGLRLGPLPASLGSPLDIAVFGDKLYIVDSGAILALDL